MPDIKFYYETSDEISKLIVKSVPQKTQDTTRKLKKKSIIETTRTTFPGILNRK